MGVGSMKSIGLILVSFLFAFALLAQFAAADTEYQIKNPASCSGEWTNCENANSNSNEGAATAVVQKNSPTPPTKVEVSGIWSDYKFILPDDAVIAKVNVLAYFKSDNEFGYIKVRVFDGNKWSEAFETGGNTEKKDQVIDITNAFPGQKWTPALLKAIKVEATCFQKPGALAVKSECSLYLLAVQVGKLTCVYSDPGLTISPVCPIPKVGFGGTVTYTVTVTNKDNEACKENNYEMKLVYVESSSKSWKPAGIFDPASFNLKPGVTQTITFTLSIPPQVPKTIPQKKYGVYEFQIKVTDTGKTQFHKEVIGKFELVKKP